MKTALLALSILSSVALADKPREPHLIELLGKASYIPVEMTEVKQAQFIYVNTDLAKAEGYQVSHNRLTPKGLADLRKDVAYAVPAKAEGPEFYGSKKVVGHASGNGGIGLNGNLGDGRSATIIEGYRAKGAGRTGRVGPQAESDHKSGGMILSDAIRETIWSNLLSYEAPFGAYRALTIFATGTQTTPNFVDYQTRAILVAEEPHRFGHSVINDTAEDLGGHYAANDRERVQANMMTLPESLPLPAGIDEKKLLRTERFKIGLNEAIDRQAIQHGYLWAHRMFHGATSPANASLDGRLLDFGTMISLEGYSRIQILRDDGPSGGTEVLKRDLFKNVRDSWIKTLPSDLLAVLPSEADIEKRFDQKFQETQRLELVRNAGAIDAVMPELRARAETQKLGEVLFKIATAHNKDIQNLWDDRESPNRVDGYNLETILVKLAAVPSLDLETLDRAIATEISDSHLRMDVVRSYKAVFTLQKTIAARSGVSTQAEAKYRSLAASVRNRPMRSLFYSAKWDQEISKVINDFESTKDGSIVQSFIDRKISESRREFRDAAPFSIVLEQRRDPKTGEAIQKVFDSLSNQLKLSHPTAIEASAVSTAHTQRRSAPGSCSMLFAK